MDEKQLSLLDDHEEADNGPVVCLGMTFKNDEERREYFRNELRKKLPELKKIEGFPIGDDEDIIALSDPPYYTACPNPWINDFIEEWEREKKEKYGRDENEEYHREPFAADVGDGRSHPVYMAHSYHTKTPHKSIMRYILHYTNPGDIVFDGFSGTGMTGVAARTCADINAIKELGYQIKDGKIYDNGVFVSNVGERKSLLNDLSPIATNIAYSYNSNSSIQSFRQIAESLLNEVEEKYGWMFETEHRLENGIIKKGKINYVVWSDVFICPNCSNELVYWDCVVDLDNNKMNDDFCCKHCGIELSKKELERSFETVYDNDINEVVKRAKQVPVLVNYSYGNKRYERKPVKYDLDILEKIEKYNISSFIPTLRMIEGDESRRNDKIGITHVHHLYPKRNLIILSYLFEKAIKEDMPLLRSWLTSSMIRTTKMYKFTLNRKMSTVSGTYYVPSLWTENIATKLLSHKLSDFCKVDYGKAHDVIVSTCSSTNLNIKDNSVDYIFVDPPFGSNLMYSELNFIWESWIRVFTNNKPEAVMSNTQRKKLSDYQVLMEQAFREFARILKPGRWITVQFSNSQSSVWNAIQDALQKAGFVIANVSALDKKQGSFKAVTTTTAVKQDLVISAYKPKQENIEKMRREQNTEESAWTFVRQHLEQLPVFIGHKGEAQIIAERTPRILFDRMVAYHVQNGLPVPISSAEFQAGVAQRFPMRDGMAFLESQVAEYDKKRTLVKEFAQMSLFVTDETSAIEWLRQQLLKKPQTRQDIHPNFMKEIQHIAKHEKLPELDDLLHQNFLKYEGDGPVPDQIASYLRRNYKDLRGLENDDPQLKEKAMNRWYVPDPNKQADLEKLREKALLREFEGYLEELEKSKKKLKQFRTEAIRAGFKKAWSEKDYEKIVKVGERLPENVIQEDDKLLMYYDNAQIRLGL
ncbi:DNA methyltransferase [Thermolongibacillus altinsuensis]|uniref:DNA methyltransferase n=1 Tax=Thermolongibacillus altinsuensis TaxID=575256 RepID=UPI00242A327D|nr:DNA methyltransferase [Thermolongibacillus altinsuensis]GMB08093.1 DNA methylase [Thermolongibacillus altinsuensis]